MLDFRAKPKALWKRRGPPPSCDSEPIEVSLQSGEVRKAGLRIRVQQQPMKLLEILLERPGEVVTREELRSRVWADESFGDFDRLPPEKAGICACRSAGARAWAAEPCC